MRQRLLVACVRYALYRSDARDLTVTTTPGGLGWRFVSLRGS